MYNPNIGHRLYKKSILALCSLVVLAFANAVARAQESGPKRGFHEGGSFALSDIESINTTNGNLMMHFPLASLPAGRNGLTAGINLTYSSKLYNTGTSWVSTHYDPGEPGGLCSNPGGCAFQTTALQQSNDGGWKYQLAYQVEVVDRRMEGSVDPRLQCSVAGYLEGGYLPLTYVYKVKLHFPDGSVHEMRPNGYTDLNSEDPLGDYYNISPDGWLEDCYQGGHWSTASTISYYSTDGTYLRFDIQVTHTGWWNNAWTLYLPDGTRVTGVGWNSNRIYDRNNNYIEVLNIANYQGTGLPAAQLVDQLGRSTTLQYSTPDGDAIHEQGFGDELVWKVHWKGIRVGKNYMPCPESGMSCQTNPSPPLEQWQMFGPGLAVVDRITLPVQAGALSYTFSYNAPDYVAGWPPPSSLGWGELSGVTLPSSAQASYQYDLDGSDWLYTPDVMKDFPNRKDLSYNQEYDGAANPVTETWHYSTADNNGAGSVTAPDGGTSVEYAVPTNYSVSWQYWSVGLVYRSVRPDGSIVERIWAPNNLADYGGSWSRADNPYVKTEFTSIKNAAGTYVKTAIKDYSYDKNGDVTRVAEYDWLDYASVPRNANGFPTGIPSGAVPSRVTTNNYYAPTADASQTTTNGYVYWFQSSPQWKNAIASSELSDGSGNVRSHTELTYDNPFSTGNLIQKTSWDSTKGGYSSPLTSGNSVSVFSQYNSWSNGATGKLIQTTDARGTSTVLSYDPVGGFDLYPTQTVTAYGTSIARTETRAYNFSTGLVTSATDADNNVTTATSYDVFGRPTLVQAAQGKPEETRTSTEYSDVNRRVIVRSDLNAIGDGLLVKIQHYDQLGRVRLARQLEDSTTQSAYDETAGIKVQTRYSFSGSNSYTVSSNPYRAAYSSQESDITMGWTRSKSDNTGRIVEVGTFGGSGLPAPWGSNTTSTGAVTTAYDANFTTVTDQAGKMRRSMTNGLDQLARVDEPGDPNTNSSLGTTDGPAQPTSYVYDALGNLMTVNQGSQTRNFAYSSLARLLTAKNPESGTISYQYDNSGNLLSKTDARGVVTSYAYDALNRATSRSYSDGTPAVTYTYDSASIAYGHGRLVSESSSVSSYSYSGYDALGRALGGTQTIGSQNYPVSYSYNRAGHVLTQTYPSTRTVTNTYDNAGRLNSFTGNLGDGTTRTYATGISYDNASHWTREQFGTTPLLYNKRHYNNRGQLYDMRVSSVNDDGDGNRGNIVNYYNFQNFGFGTTGSDNNGNLLVQQVWIPDANGNYTVHQQNYAYDSLNRLTWVGEYLNGSQNTGAQTYSYDRFGNRFMSGWGTGTSNQQFSVDTNTNRLGVPAGHYGTMAYDQAGNLTYDSYSGEGPRTYDAENRMNQAWSNNQWQTYSYDGDGHRVKRNVNGTETWQVYGFGGELIAEYAANAGASSPQKEYGYRNGELLITADAASGGGSGPQNVIWTNAVGVSASGNNLTKTATDGWTNGGASSTQSIPSGDGYMEVTASETNTYRMIGLSHGDTDQSYASINYAIFLEANGTIDVFESGTPRSVPGIYATGDVFRVAVEGGVVKYKKNGTVIYTSTVAPTYPLLVDTSLYSNGSTLTNVVITSAGGGSSTSARIHWLVTDQLGTPRMIFDQSGSLANVSRHDYLPFGEELFVGTGSRTQSQGYSASDGVRQKFTDKERDAETGLDYFGARYYASTQGRFASADPIMASGKAPEPQSWNRYAYCYGNPLKYVDPDGMDIQTLDDKARKLMINTLPASIRKQVRSAIDKNGLLKAGSLDKIKSTDPNFLKLRAMVNAKSTTEVATAATGQNGVAFFRRTWGEQRQIDIANYMKNNPGVSRKDAEAIVVEPGPASEVLGYEGQTYTPNGENDTPRSPSGNLRAVATDQTGEGANISNEEATVAMGHELYWHAYGFLTNRSDWKAESGPTMDAIEARSRRNFRSDQQKARPRNIRPRQ